MKAVEELQLLGVSLAKEQIDREKAAVKAYQEIQKAKRAKRKRIREQNKIQKDNSFFAKNRMIFFIISLLILLVARHMELLGKRWG